MLKNKKDKPFSKKEIVLRKKEIVGWTISVSGKKISRTFVCEDFIGAVRFVKTLVNPAEKLGHHPDVCISYNKVLVSLTTHKINGISEKDFLLAKKIDALFY